MLNDNRIIYRIARKCNDSAYSDFGMNEYAEELFEVKRKLARKYSILNRYYAFSVNIDTEKNTLEDAVKVPVRLNLQSFNGETIVRINGTEYKKASDQLMLDCDNEEYVLFYDSQEYLFNYTRRTASDKVEIFYTSDITIDDYDDESILPVIPEVYEDELIKNTLISMCELGVSRFEGSKLKKYERLYKINVSKREEGKQGEAESWPELKVFKVI